MAGALAAGRPQPSKVLGRKRDADAFDAELVRKKRELTPDVINRCRLELEAHGVGPASIRKALTLLQGVLQRACEWGRIPSNPVAPVRKPRLASLIRAVDLLNVSGDRPVALVIERGEARLEPSRGATDRRMAGWLEPVGRNEVAVCTNISCWLNGALDIVKHCERKLGIRNGQSTADGRVFLKEEEECLAACCGAPMMVVNGHYHENLTPAKVDEILDALK